MLQITDLNKFKIGCLISLINGQAFNILHFAIEI